MQPYETDIQHCLQAFQHHGIILYPTDTIWGLGCPADDPKAIQKIFDLKQRPSNKSFILLMTDVKMLFHYIANPLPDLQALLQQFQEPTTLIYPNGINLPNDVIGEDGSVAVRITQDPFCRSLIKRIRKPLVSTSANITGEPGAALFSEVNIKIRDGVDYTVTWRQDETTTSKASSIYKVEPNGSLIKLR